MVAFYEDDMMPFLLLRSLCVETAENVLGYMFLTYTLVTIKKFLTSNLGKLISPTRGLTLGSVS